MHILQIAIRIVFVASMVAAAVRTFLVVRRHGFETDTTTSWQLYLLGQRWPWVIAACGIAAGVAFVHALDALAVGVFLGHVFSPIVMQATEPDAEGNR